MKQPPDARVTPEIAREICQRTSSAAVIDGSIAQIGTQYSLILRAVNCANGESLASTEAQAGDKSHVLEALGKASSDIRKKLGESLATLQKFDTPLEQATTPSLEALQAYNLAYKAILEKADFAAAISLLQQAIRLDQNFAMAYVTLGYAYVNIREDVFASENIRKAFELRASASERERLWIEYECQHFVTGNLDKAQQACEVWVRTYPRDEKAREAQGRLFGELGEPEKAIAVYRETLRLNPKGDPLNVNALSLGIIHAEIRLDRLEEARAAAEEAKAKNIDSPIFRMLLYFLASLQGDRLGMEQQVAFAAGKPGLEDLFLDFEARQAAYSGQLEKARTLFRKAVGSAERAYKKEVAAGYEEEAALTEALVGNQAQAGQWAASALSLSTGRDVQYRAALALALAARVFRAQTLAHDLGSRFPEDTLAQFNYLPTLQAQLALSRNDAPKAIEALQGAAPYERAITAPLFPAYVRGLAYLAARRGSEAAPEFQKILDHRGLVWNSPIGPLAHIQIGRAFVMQGDRAKAKAAYKDFLALWKDADPDIPILKQAKAEYAKLP